MISKRSLLIAASASTLVVLAALLYLWLFYQTFTIYLVRDHHWEQVQGMGITNRAIHIACVQKLDSWFNPSGYTRFYIRREIAESQVPPQAVETLRRLEALPHHHQHQTVSLNARPNGLFGVGSFPTFDEDTLQGEMAGASAMNQR